jgi:hypothetical protein
MVFAWSVEFVSAQQTPPQHFSTTAVAVESGKSERIGVYVNIRPDCTAGPPPVLRIVKPPDHGQMDLELVNAQLANVGSCPRTEGPGYVASYKSKPGFEGNDSVVIEAQFPDRGGETRVEKITVRVRTNGVKL